MGIPIGILHIPHVSKSNEALLQIENWIDVEVTKLFNGNDNIGVDIDLDALLDLDSVPAKRKFVFDNLQRSHCPASMDKITMFLDEMIDQLNTL